MHTDEPIGAGGLGFVVGWWVRSAPARGMCQHGLFVARFGGGRGREKFSGGVAWEVIVSNAFKGWGCEATKWSTLFSPTREQNLWKSYKQGKLWAAKGIRLLDYRLHHPPLLPRLQLWTQSWPLRACGLPGALAVCSNGSRLASVTSSWHSC